MPLGIHIKQLSVLLGFIALSANAIYAFAISDSTKTPSSDTLAVEIFPTTRFFLPWICYGPTNVCTGKILKATPFARIFTTFPQDTFRNTAIR